MQRGQRKSGETGEGVSWVALTAARRRDALAPLAAATRLVRMAAQRFAVSPDFGWPALILTHWSRRELQQQC
jgi:hypothetical protein